MIEKLEFAFIKENGKAPANIFFWKLETSRRSVTWKSIVRLKAQTKFTLLQQAGRMKFF
jgi:hypothetical protein